MKINIRSQNPEQVVKRRENQSKPWRAALEVQQGHSKRKDEHHHHNRKSQRPKKDEDMLDEINILDDLEDDESCCSKYRFQIISSLVIVAVTVAFYFFFVYVILDDDGYRSKSGKDLRAELDLMGQEYCFDFLYKGQCVKSCPPKTFQLEVNCLDKCPEGYYISSGQCISFCNQLISQEIYCGPTCAAEEKYVLNRKCYTACPKPYYAHKSSCLLECPEGWFRLARNCVEACPSFHFANSTCTNVCPGKYIPDNATKLCHVDDAELHNMVYHENETVRKCPAGYFESDKFCQSQCLDGYYRNYEASACTPCGRGCHLCGNPSGACTRCRPGYYLLEGECVSNCSEVSGDFQGADDQLCKRGCQVQNIQQHLIFSEYLQKSMSVITVSSNELNFFPKLVIYVFHDYNETPAHYLQYDIQCMIQKMNLLVVLVQGDGNCYVDLDQHNLYMKFFAEEVVPYLNEKMYLSNHPRNHAVMGFGMGAVGALQTVLRYPFKFGIAALARRNYSTIPSLADYAHTPEHQQTIGRNATLAAQYDLSSHQDPAQLNHTLIILTQDKMSKIAVQRCHNQFPGMPVECLEVNQFTGNGTLLSNPYLRKQQAMSDLIEFVYRQFYNFDY